ncbi:MAG: alpha-galactosidase [Phycisphaerae bacterium]
MPTICFLGAGSSFVEPLATDLMLVPALAGSTLRLVDIDERRLEAALGVARLIAERTDRQWTVDATTRRQDALAGANYIVNCIEVSGLDCVRADQDIPLKFGVSQCIGDTIGPGGLFRALRTIPVWLEVLRDCETLCPDAWVLNYTNPMSMMCLAAFRSSSTPVIGLCHSVQGSSQQLADYTGVPYDELEWSCGGINHMAWFTTLRHNGHDLYPALREKVQKDAELFEKDPVRFDMMVHFGAFVTESSGHFSEYLPYYRKRPELIKKYCRAGYLGEESFYANNWPIWRKTTDDRRQRVLATEEELRPLVRSREYASQIIEAHETDCVMTIHGNLVNRGLIENLPLDGCVEVACEVDATGIQPVPFGPLPRQMAALCASNMAMFDLAATAAIERSKEAAIHALMVDPLTAAVCSPAEIRAMANELFEAERTYLPDYR